MVLDDTSYFLSCSSSREADFIVSLLNSDVCQQFYSAFVFWDSKRPITVSNLSQLNLEALASELGLEDTMSSFRKRKSRKQKRLQFN